MYASLGFSPSSELGLREGRLQSILHPDGRGRWYFGRPGWAFHFGLSKLAFGVAGQQRLSVRKTMRTAKIVLIEDNPADVFLIEMVLKESEIPYELTKFQSGEDAIGALCAPGGRTTKMLFSDAIFLDLHTPKSDGFVVLGKLRQTPHLAEVPIAILTSSQSIRDKNRVGLLGHTRYIEKVA